MFVGLDHPFLSRCGIYADPFSFRHCIVLLNRGKKKLMKLVRYDLAVWSTITGHRLLIVCVFEAETLSTS